MAARQARITVPTEPSTPITTPTALTSALTYYRTADSYEFGWLTTFMGSYGFTAEEVEAVKDRKALVSKTVMAMARLWNLNLLPLQSEHEQRLVAKVRELIATPLKDVAVEAKPDVSYKKDSIVDRYIADIDNIVDLIGYATVPVIISLDLSRLNNSAKAELKKFYEPKLNEIRAVVHKTDPELVLAYASTKANLVRMGEFYAGIVGVDFKLPSGQGAESPATTIKSKRTFKQRKPRAPKFNKLRYAGENAELGLTSIDPLKVHGATTLITYNAKYGSVSIYHAEEGKTLTFKRTSLINFDEAKSFTKRASRAKALLGVLKTGRKGEIVGAFNAAKSQPTLATSIMNKDTVLVAAY